jgi:hypothetical protein
MRVREAPQHAKSVTQPTRSTAGYVGTNDPPRPSSSTALGLVGRGIAQRTEVL